MAPLLPTELLLNLNQSCYCRELQLRQLATFYNNHFAPPPALVVYGLEGTGKYGAIKSVLEARAITSATVKCADGLSLRHLLSKIFVGCAKATGQLRALEEFDRVDSLNSLTVGLQRLLQSYGQRLVLVLSGIDQQRGASPTLLPTLVRLGDIIPQLSVIFISASPRPLHLQKVGVPHIYFPPYTRNELIVLVTSPPQSHLLPHSEILSNSVDQSIVRKLHIQFTATVYDSLIGPTASTSLSVFRSTCTKLWPRFIWPLITNEPPPGRANTWDFARLLVRNRILFQKDGESALIERLQPTGGPWTFEELHAASAAKADVASAAQPSRSCTAITGSTEPKATPAPLLKHFSTLLLTSSFLASHTPPKLDILLFSRLSSSSKSHRVRKNYHRKKLFLQSPSKNKAGAINTRSSTLDLKMGVSRPFTLERLVAITRAIHPQGVPNRKSISDRVYRHLAELERLRLVISANGSAGYDDEEKWRVNVSREWVEDMAGEWGVGLAEFEVGAT